MSYDFPTNSFASLSPEEQISTCRAMVVEAANLATAATNEAMREAYRNLAKQWGALAEEMAVSRGVVSEEARASERA